MEKKIVVLTGAGVSAESGIQTFRDSNGLWENHRVEDVATPEGWHRDYKMVLRFYNDRLKQMKAAQPNAAHLALAKLEAKYDVTVVTQNVDNLHERAGSSKVIHLHGEITKARSQVDENYIVDIEGDELKDGALCPYGKQLRPHIVWFGEAVPMIEKAVEVISQADIAMVIGTSMVVYPAASLIHYAPKNIPVYYIDPKASHIAGIANLTCLQDKAGAAVPKLVEELLSK